MKRKIKSLLCLAMACAMILSMTVMAGAAVRASDYFSYTDVTITSTGSGSFAVEFDIDATHVMQEVGATKIVIWERQSDGSYDDVKTFTRYNNGGLIATDTAFGYGIVRYNGTAGVKYYATVVLFAKDSDGSESMYCDTRVLTA